MHDNRVDFQTHYTYVRRLHDLSRTLRVTCTQDPNATPVVLSRVSNKLQLIRLTWLSLRDEGRIVDADEDYSSASVLWLPIKTYYLLYHLLSVIDLLLTGEMSSLSIGHGRCAERFTERLQAGELMFSEPRFNKVYDASIFDFKEISGEHLKAGAPADLIYTLLMKKIASYKIDDERLRRGWNLRRLADRMKRDKYKAKLKVSIFDFFYLMRLRSNYRGFSFIDDLPATETARYFRAFFGAGRNFVTAFGGLRRDLESRVGK